MPPRDYYKVLGVSKTASADEVKTAYRKLARQYHPDVNKAPDAADRFKEATAAYDVLSDPQKRRMYDQFGHAGVGAEGPPGPRGGPRVQWQTRGPGAPGFAGPGAPGSDFEDVFSSSPFSGMSLEQLLAALSGGMRPPGGRRSEPAPTVDHPVTLEFLQAASGCTIALQLTRPDGSTETLRVKVPPGVDEGSRIRLRGQGGGGSDLYIVTHVRPHPHFRRDGNDITIDLPVSVTEAAEGASITVPTVDGPAVLKVPPATSSRSRLRLRGKGATDPKTGKRGDQYAVVRIVLPKKISAEGLKLLRQFAETDPIHPRENTGW